MGTHPTPEDMRSLERLAQGYQLTFYGSGTQALSHALTLARGDRARQSPPEVILPAYGCPDLLAASLHAGLQVRLVDVYPDVWGYDVKRLQSTLTADTAAVLAVNLLGVGDQHDLLRDISKGHRCSLIQDSAQYLPDLDAPSWCGDAVILSFGRGKPLNLLQGGALLSRDRAVAPSSDPDPEPEPMRVRILSWSLAALAFNAATHPRIYPVTSRLPGFKIGETRYTPLVSCHELPDKFRLRVASAFAQYHRQQNYSVAPWKERLAEWEAMGIRVLSCDGSAKCDAQYLRMPLLAPTPRIRERILIRLNAAGLGASAMYQVPLNRIADVPESIRHQGPFPGAEALAARILTLPTHDSVTPSIVDQTCREMRRAMRG